MEEQHRGNALQGGARQVDDHHLLCPEMEVSRVPPFGRKRGGWGCLPVVTPTHSIPLFPLGKTPRSSITNNCQESRHLSNTSSLCAIKYLCKIFLSALALAVWICGQWAWGLLHVWVCTSALPQAPVTQQQPGPRPTPCAAAPAHSVPRARTKPGTSEPSGAPTPVAFILGTAHKSFGNGRLGVPSACGHRAALTEHP